jgi:hypothetical protein
MQKIQQKTLDKVAKGILNSRAVEHKRLKEPTKTELNKKFVIRVKTHKLVMKEV